jgi:alanine dehydrogenase
MQLRILSATDVKASIDMPMAITAMRAAFGQLASGQAVLPQRVGLDTPAGVSLFMPGFLPADDVAAAKMVSVFPGNAARGLPPIHAVVLVIDPGSGVPRALMDGTYLTALRTGAVGGLATDLLARKDARVAALFGAGAQARTQLEALLVVREIEEVRVVAGTQDEAEAFAEEMAALHGVVVRACGVAEAVRGADIIVAATSSATPVFPGELLEPGMHVTGVGSFTPQMRELPPELPARATVVIDEIDASREEAGELIDAVERGLWSWGAVHAELGEIVNGTRRGRGSADEITFFKSVGVAVQDVAVAARVLERAEGLDLGTVVEI